MQLGKRLALLRSHIQELPTDLGPACPGCVLFFSLSDGLKQATVFHVAGKNVDEAWARGAGRLPLLLKKNRQIADWLRVDMVRRAEALPWHAFTARLASCRRNFFRYGLALDPAFTIALLEQECNANSLFYGHNKQETAEFNLERFQKYTRKRFGSVPAVPGPDDTVVAFSSSGAFCAKDGILRLLPGPEDGDNVPAGPGPKAGCGPDAGLYAGRRALAAISHQVLDEVIRGGSRYLAGQMKENGEFVYGYLPGFAQRLTSYNRVRHSGTIFALLDALEHTGDETLRPAIDAGIEALATRMVRRYTLPSGEDAAFLVEADGEIKLGGNGVSLVALSRWQKMSGDDAYLPVMKGLAAGIAFMQHQETGEFVHVLDARDLAVKEARRTVYYDGEALFGLMQIYGVTGDGRWLAIAEKALEAFIALKHWRHHDHWLSYAANEITLYKPEDRYFQFGLRNAASHVDFIMERETTYPTLLELCMAAEKMIRRLESMPEKRRLLQEIDLEKFRLATKRRAEYVLNGYFWSETAMYFHKPYQVLGSFFIRHHGFRVRIDDVGHYLCGLVAYDALFGGTPA